MAKVLVVGDMHITPSNLVDSGKIFDLIISNSNREDVDAVVFLGDLTHTHAVVRQEVGFFLKQKMSQITKKKYILVGNHDGSTPHSTEKNALRMIFSNDEAICDQQEGRTDLIGSKLACFIPFIGDNDKFLEACNKHKQAYILFHHQTIFGAKYENGYPAPGGVDIELIPQQKLVGGHLHQTQSIGKNFYPGTPRAVNSSEYNEDKGIYVLDLSSESKEFISTNSLVKCYKRYSIVEGNENVEAALLEIINSASSWKKEDDIRLHVTGNEEFYEKVQQNIGKAFSQLRLVPDIRKDLSKKINTNASDFSINKALHSYVHEIIDENDDMRREIWNKITQNYPSLSSNSSL